MSRSSLASSSIADYDDYMKGFNISFSWDYPDDWSLKDVEETVFHLLDEKDTQRSESQFICNCIQSSGAGVILSQPHPESDVVPCELHFTAHPMAVQFCITKVVVVSEARHLELYLDDLYEKTSKGCMLTVKKGNKAALYENEFDLSAHVQGTHKVSLKFLSLADKHLMRLQTVVVKVVKCVHNNCAPPQQQEWKSGSSMDMNSVREMMETMGLSVPNSADKLMNDIEHQQKQRIQMQQFVQNSLLGSGQQPPAVLLQQLPVMTSSQGLLASMLPQNPLMQMPNMQQIMPLLNQGQAQPTQLNYAHRNSLQPDIHPVNTQLSSEHRTNTLPPSLFPVSRENVPVTRGKPLHRRKSFSSADSYDGFGTPNPPHQSALVNAILNTEQVKQVAASKAEVIAEDNYEKAQLNMIKNFLRSQDSTKLSITKTAAPAKPPRRLRSSDKKKRPHSLAALPSSSELDFTKLLSNLMEQEGSTKESSGDEDSATSVSNARWEAYLRSRVRASQRLSSERPNSGTFSETEQERQYKDSGFHSPRSSSTTMNGDPSKSCGYCGCSERISEQDMSNIILETEQRIMGRVELKIQELRHHLDLRLDSLYDSIVALHPQNFVDNNIDYSEQEDTAV